VLFVTHSVDEAIYLGDRVLVMGTSPGRIVADVSIALPRPRYEGDVRATIEFGRLRHVIREAMPPSLRPGKEAANAGRSGKVGELRS